MPMLQSSDVVCELAFLAVDASFAFVGLIDIKQKHRVRRETQTQKVEANDVRRARQMVGVQGGSDRWQMRRRRQQL